MLLRLAFCLSLLTLAACQAENQIVLRDPSSASTVPDAPDGGTGTNGTPIQDAVSNQYKARYTVGEPLVGKSQSTHYRASVGARRQSF